MQYTGRRRQNNIKQEFLASFREGRECFRVVQVCMFCWQPEDVTFKNISRLCLKNSFHVPQTSISSCLMSRSPAARDAAAAAAAAHFMAAAVLPSA